MARRGGSRYASGQQEEWQQAREWLMNLNVLQPHLLASSPSARVFDFAQGLRDGVLLCHTANRLLPNSILDINMKPQMSQFLCLKNIRAFLAACELNFGLNPTDLFDATELYDVSDFGKVIHTLSVLSHVREATNLGVEPFPPVTPARKPKRSPEYDDIYSNLEDLALHRDITEEENPYDAVTIEEGDKIYEDLVNIKIKEKKGKPSRQSSLEEKRKYVVAELLETERGYVQALQMIEEHFIKKLQNQLSPDDKETIFINIEDLLKLHSKLLAKLEKACTEGLTIGVVFLDTKDDLLKYGKYCTGMPEAQAFIDELTKTDPKFRDSLEDCQNRAKSKFALRSLLVVPFQRVLKYPLLIQELNKQTKADHPDKEGLQKALATVQDVAAYINQTKRDDENMKTVKDIQDSLSSTVDVELAGFGRMIRDGELQVRSSDQPPKKRYLFLFDRALVICKTKGETYHHKQTLYLEFFEVQDNSIVPDKRRFAHSWHVKHVKSVTGEQEKNSVTMFAKTADMKAKWVNDIKTALANLTLKGVEQGGHQFELYTFSYPTYCQACGTLLRGIICQGYKCVICDSAAHKDCIPRTRACRSSPNSQSKHFSGTSPFQPRPHVASRNSLVKQTSSPVPPTLSPEAVKKSRKISAPPNLGFPSQRTQPTVFASASFTGVAPGRRPALNFSAGDQIEVSQRSDPEWWQGKSLRTGVIGYFPRSYVRTQEEQEEFDKKQKMRRTRQSYERTTIKEESDSMPPPPGLNTNLEHFKWFGGKKDRPKAEVELNGRSDGTFMVRESANRVGEFALSIRFRGSCKHIKIQYKENVYFLTQAKEFNGIQELVEYYKANTLGVSFPGLDTKLRTGIREDDEPKGVGWAKALYPYNARNPKEISIQKASKILILNMDGDWWKGECNGQVGYFPSNFVEILKVEDGR